MDKMFTLRRKVGQAPVEAQRRLSGFAVTRLNQVHLVHKWPSTKLLRMARYWKEPYSGARFGDHPPDTLPASARGLVPRELICVSVCSFTFKFYSADEITEYIAFFEQKTHPSSRLPIPAGADSFFRWHSQRWYERLPMYLQEESKRQRVLKALRKAIDLLRTGKL